MIRQLFLSLGALIAAIAAAQAHSAWIEPKGDQLIIRFAEPGTDFETSPGFLDNLTAPIAFMTVTNAPVAIEATKKSDHFLLVGTSATNVACAETTFTVRAGRKPIFYARWQPANSGAGVPLLTLDLVPGAKPGEVRAYFRGKPLGGVAATLRLPDETEQELTADADGWLHFETKQSGQYLLTIPHYRETQPLGGFHVGQPYSETSHNCALTWRQ